MERSKIELEGVAAGANIFVGKFPCAWAAAPMHPCAASAIAAHTRHPRHLLLGKIDKTLWPPVYGMFKEYGSPATMLYPRMPHGRRRLFISRWQETDRDQNAGS